VESKALSQHFLNHVAVHIGEAALDAVVVKGQLFVVEAQEMEHGGVKIMEGVDILGGLESEFVGGAMTDAGLNAGTG
tara:strand:+ start:383 stop:613 length:231 start_codon:yes stop_codon:yes gene_type:complete